MRAWDLLASSRWAMTEDGLRTLAAVVERADEVPDWRPAAVAAAEGRELDNTETATERDGVAIIPVRGPLFRYANLFTRISGATSYEIFARDFNAALENPAVHAILLDVDSPGGEVNGVHETAELIFGARGRKPIVAYVGGVGASGAYWIASAADEIVADQTALLGGVGTIARYVDFSKADEKAGIREIVIVSRQSPDKDTNPAETEGRARIQAMLDELATVFISAVARNRGVEDAEVIADFGRGWVRVGEAAVEAGLADRLGSFEGVLAELAARSSVARLGGGFNATSEARGTMPEQQNPPAAEQQPAITVEHLEANHAAVVTEIRTAAATAERARILGIQELAIAGHEELVTAAVNDPAVTPEAFALQLVRAEKATGSKALARLQRDEQDLNAPAATAREDDVTPEATEDPLKPNPAHVARIVNAGRAQAATTA